jgi:hypothetical protein
MSETNSILKDKSFAFAIEIVKTYKDMKIIQQLLKAINYER